MTLSHRERVASESEPGEGTNKTSPIELVWCEVTQIAVEYFPLTPTLSRWERGFRRYSSPLNSFLTKGEAGKKKNRERVA